MIIWEYGIQVQYISFLGAVVVVSRSQSWVQKVVFSIQWVCARLCVFVTGADTVVIVDPARADPRNTQDAALCFVKAGALSVIWVSFSRWRFCIQKGFPFESEQSLRPHVFGELQLGPVWASRVCSVSLQSWIHQSTGSNQEGRGNKGFHIGDAGTKNWCPCQKFVIGLDG